jgi:HK97 family phage major capsid protein
MPELNTQEVMESVTALRAELKSLSPDLDKVNLIEKSIESFEENSQKIIAAQKESDQKAIEMEEKASGMEELIKTLEIEVARNGTSSEKNFRDTPEYKSLYQFVMTGDFKDSEQKSMLRTDSDIAGGFLVPVEMDNQITKEIVDISDIRSIARVRTIGAKTLEIPVRSSIPVATYEGETDAGDDSTSKYANESLTAFRQTHTVPITMDMLMDSAFNMDSEIMSDSAEAFAKGEGTGFVNGSGHKQPSGFLQDSRVTGLTSSTSGTIDADDIILLSGEIKSGYSGTYVFNRRTLAFLRTLKATDGNFLWQPGLNGVVANTINGSPYIVADDMPDIASNSKSVAFGDFLRGYTIVDRTGISVVRDEFTAKRKAIVEFTINRWNTGQVTLAEAIKTLTTAA